MYSYHIFYFPFKWKVDKWESKLFEEQTNIENIPINTYTDWIHNPGPLNQGEESDLYNEKNFFYEFIHPVLYDTGEKGSLLKHYERKEPQQRDVSYTIKCKDKTYILKVDAINLNLYVTGTGMLSFYLENEREDQSTAKDILTINQFGRRVFPPFFDDIKNKVETAEYLKIEGLNGDPLSFYEDFSGYTSKDTWSPASFIRNLINDLSEELIITPVIDDRMFVNCWYEDEEHSNRIGENEEELKTFFIGESPENEGNRVADFWYKYIYVDVDSPTCKNDELKLELLNRQTYKRWQKDGALYGASRYSFVFLTRNDNWFQKNILAKYMRTVYSRVVELVLIQKASSLSFSEEITQLSRLSKGKAINPFTNKQIASLYKEYIRFLNQIHFRETTVQDQGLELYQLIYKTLNIEKCVEDLDKEIEELHQYVAMLDDKERNKNAEILNTIAAIFLPATLFSSLLGSIEELSELNGWIQTLILLGAPTLMYGLLQIIKKNR